MSRNKPVGVVKPESTAAKPSREQLQLVVKWLSDLSSHDIYGADNLAADFTKVTGLLPCWSTYTEKQTFDAIRARGLGGHVKAASGKRLAYGYVVAEALARQLVPEYQCTKLGRGSVFFEALEALQNACK